MLIEGQSGSGKSTMLLKILVDIYSKYRDVYSFGGFITLSREVLDTRGHARQFYLTDISIYLDYLKRKCEDLERINSDENAQNNFYEQIKILNSSDINKFLADLDLDNNSILERTIKEDIRSCSPLLATEIRAVHLLPPRKGPDREVFINAIKKKLEDIKEKIKATNKCDKKIFLVMDEILGVEVEDESVCCLYKDIFELTNKDERLLVVKSLEHRRSLGVNDKKVDLEMRELFHILNDEVISL